MFRSTRPAPVAEGIAARGAPLVIDVSKVLDDPLGRSKTASATAAPGSTGQPLSTAGRPRIAIFVSGMGLSQAADQGRAGHDAGGP